MANVTKLKEQKVQLTLTDDELLTITERFDDEFDEMCYPTLIKQLADARRVMDALNADIEEPAEDNSIAGRVKRENAVTARELGITK
jgi:hypothetical protein